VLPQELEAVEASIAKVNYLRIGWNRRIASYGLNILSDDDDDYAMVYQFARHRINKDVQPLALWVSAHLQRPLPRQMMRIKTLASLQKNYKDANPNGLL
jgi:hypothetical protein